MTRDELLKKICPCGTCDCGDDYESCNCDDCNRVLEEWLYDYEKHVIEQYKADTNLKDTIREIHDNVAREMYCKGVDDFSKLLREIRDNRTLRVNCDDLEIKHMEEQLKEWINPDEDGFSRTFQFELNGQIKAFENLKIEDVNMFQLGYNKALDDFIHECDKYCGFYSGKDKSIKREDILKIAKQLKERE